MRCAVLALLMTALMCSSSAAHADQLADGVAADAPRLTALYRALHAAPELSFMEVQTAARLVRELDGLGFTVTPHVGGTGVVAVMKNGPGPVLLIRTDMDALPVKEQTGLAFASTVVGRTREGVLQPVMHACGHDVHMSAWIGVARRLSALRGQWSGTVVMIGQPAEERVGGARAMLSGWAIHALPSPHVRAGPARRCVAPRGRDRLHAGLCDGERRQCRGCRARHQRPRRGAQSHEGSRAARCTHRRWSAAAHQPRDRPAGRGRGDGRLDPRGYRVQLDAGRGSAPNHPAQLRRCRA